MAMVVKYLLMVSIMFLMLGVGLRTAFREVINVVRQLGPVMRGILANFLVVPLLFYLALQFLPFRPDVVIGLLIMAAVPVAPMAPPFVDKAKGDVLYAVGLMTVIALLCVPLTPAILLLCLPKSEAGLELSVIAIVFPSQQINQLDSTGANQLAKLQAELGAEGITLYFAEAKNALRQTMRRAGLEAKIGVDHFYDSIEDGVQAFLKRGDQQTDQVVKG